MAAEESDITDAEVNLRMARFEAQHTVDQHVIAQLEAEGVVDRNQIANLETALVSARRIGAAIGIVMNARKVTEDQAFEVLRVASQNSHRKLRDVAEDVLRTGTVA